MTESFLGPLLRRRDGRVALHNARSGGLIAATVLTAFESKGRRAGLLAYASLPAGVAMVIAPSNAIHTFFMRFAIDVAFVARDGRIVKTHRSLGPWRIAAALGAYAVVELPAGTLARLDTVVGDRLVLVKEPAII